MVEVSCNSCESAEHHVLAREGRFGMLITTVVCKNCGLVFTNPRFDAEENALFYAHFYKVFFRGNDKPDDKHLETQRKKAMALHAYLESHDIDVSSLNSVLDVGCSAGGMLKYFSEQGSKITVGIEPSENYSSYARDIMNLNVYTSTLEEYLEETKDAIFDLVIMRDVLEHLLDPRKALQALKGVINENTILFIETNNVFKSLNPTERYSYQFHYGHPYIFSRNTLKAMLAKSGYYPVDVQADRYIRCLARLGPAEKYLDLQDDYNDVEAHIRRHDRYLGVSSFTFELRRFLGRLRQGL